MRGERAVSPREAPANGNRRGGRRGEARDRARIDGVGCRGRDAIGQSRSKRRVLSPLQLAYLSGVIWFCEKAAVTLHCLFLPPHRNLWGNFSHIWAWLIRREALLPHFRWCWFPLSQVNYCRVCIRDCDYLRCKWTNQPLKTAGSVFEFIRDARRDDARFQRNYRSDKNETR